MVKKAVQKIEKELDLLRFIKQMRVQMTAIMSLLSVQQFHFTKKFAQIVVRENSSDSSSGEEYSADENEFERFAE